MILIVYGLEKLIKEQKILVYDFGGGTFDVSVLDMAKESFEVLATSVDNRLYGDDWDQRLIDWLFDEVIKERGVDLSKAAEKAKINLSATKETQILIYFNDFKWPLNIEKTLTKEKFEDLTKYLLDRTIKHAEDAIKESKLSFNDINQVLLVVGSTRMPNVQELIQKITGKEPNKTVNPEEVDAMGQQFKVVF